ncbi:MAG TPA: HAD family hydrolase [Steroidobacteraceae bacterium]|nr:HAD family hydrolase [Steroidobacteraceae bacterium]
MPHIRALCFDLDNTLWDVWPVIRRAEQRMYDFLAECYPRVVARVTLEAMREARERVAERFPQMQHDFTFLRKQALRDHALHCGYEETLVEEAFDEFIRARNEVELYPDVLPGLERLRRRFRLFTASNGNADLNRIGLAHFFERTVNAREVGALKPAPAMFHRAIEGTDLAPGEVAYIGDDPALDVEGARRAGMRAIWVDRLQSPWPEGIAPPSHRVSTLTELVELLETDPTLSSQHPNGARHQSV